MTRHFRPIIQDSKDTEIPDVATPPEELNDLDTRPDDAGYQSDTSNEDPMDMVDSDDDDSEGDRPEDNESGCEEPQEEVPSETRENQPKRKRQKLNISVLKARQSARESKNKILKSALVDIERFIRSRKTEFDQGGTHGLQSYRARAIESYLRLVVKKKYGGVPASEIAAEGLGFAKVWGGRQVRRWARVWMNDRELPQSERGCHVKVKTLLEDPAIKTELRTFMRSNKWSMDPKKLQKFTNNTLLPDEAAKYGREITEQEMPRGLKKYLELELFPRIHMKVGKGISLSTARRWLQEEGFEYTVHKKAIFYDGHDRPDVLEYRQEKFLPAMKEYRKRLVEYKMGDAEVEIDKQLPDGVRKLVLLAHDESTNTANDGPKASWVLEGEQPILKKGAGRGSHRSDVICSTHGWLKDAGVQIEYGKNHDGFWNGQMFVDQVNFFLS
jgi:hypothetical protein